jgi:hypothetical protein
MADSRYGTWSAPFRLQDKADILVLRHVVGSNFLQAFMWPLFRQALLRVLLVEATSGVQCNYVTTGETGGELVVHSEGNRHPRNPGSAGN